MELTDVYPHLVEEHAPKAPDPYGSHHAPIKLQALLETTFAPHHWVIDDLMPEGLVLLAGKPKQGKSWLALQMALAVSTGEAIFDSHYQTHAGHVLYLALEDTLQRLQDRARRLLSTMHVQPAELELAVTWPRLDQGGLSQLEAYIEQHPRLRLIVIDTWSKIAPRSSSRTRTQYEEDYASIAPLKQLAQTHHLCILLIHHLRKATGKDILDEVTGSTGLVGAVDGVLLLKREREQEDATLFVTGRDLAEQSLALTFDPTVPRWTCAREQNAFETEAAYDEHEQANAS